MFWRKKPEEKKQTKCAKLTINFHDGGGQQFTAKNTQGKDLAGCPISPWRDFAHWYHGRKDSEEYVFQNENYYITIRRDRIRDFEASFYYV